MLSVIIPTFNRRDLFKVSLETIKNQTFQDFELIIIDNNSAEDIKSLLKGFNARFIKWDHCLHTYWKEMNPTGERENENWYHTPAQAINIGLSKARGDVCLLTQSEILHSPDSFAIGYEMAKQNKQVFAEILMSSLDFRPKHAYNFDEMIADTKRLGLEYEFAHQPPDFYELYWFICYLPTQIAKDINGVDLKYQQGVYGEDDQFKMRMRMAGCEDIFAGRPLLKGTSNGHVVGIHQSHRDEKHKNQQRESKFWNDGANRNREIFRQFCSGGEYLKANEGCDFDIWGQNLIVEETDYEIRKS